MSLRNLMALDTTPERLGEPPLESEADPPDEIDLLDALAAEAKAEVDPFAPGEFDDLLTSLGAEAPDPGPYDDLRLRDQMIVELSENLEMLKPIGQQLAASERSRIVLLDKLTNAEARLGTLEFEREDLLKRLAESESRTPGSDDATARTPTEDREDQASELDALRRKLERERKAGQRLKTRLERTKSKLDERHRTAAQRWREILELKRERKRLREALESRE